ncbi:transglutaminase domain-containing protein [Micromonospora sp. NPDC049662]|uniref:transglutaminase domain-containing protein n=1 Tax=Micromonospora sp. NPDC049662 TaxID=3155397 RepID=UPI0034179272
MTEVVAGKRWATDRLGDLVGRIRRVPDTHRQFGDDLAIATRLHRIDPPLLERLLDVGLPHRGTGPDRLFDSLDLENVALDLGLPSPRGRAIRWWSRALVHDKGDLSRLRSVTVSSRCPDVGHRGVCDFALRQDLARTAVSGRVRASGGSFQFDVRMTHREVRLGRRFTPLVEQVTPLQFHILPRTLHDDLGFARATQLASCGLATRLTVHLARDLSLPVRSAYGYFMTEPYLTWHTWPEFNIDGEWMAADPFMLNACYRWGLAGSDRWAVTDTVSGLMWTVGRSDPDAPSAPYRPVTHCGTPVPATLMAKVASAELDRARPN